MNSLLEKEGKAGEELSRPKIDEDSIETYRGRVSLSAEAGEHKRIAVKIVDDRPGHQKPEGDEGGKMNLRIEFPREAIVAFCKKWRIVEFAPDARYTLFD